MKIKINGGYVYINFEKFNTLEKFDEITEIYTNGTNIKLKDFRNH